MNETILHALEESGLTKTESVVYLELLRRGSSTAYRISKEAKLYKANTYDAIDSLVKKQFVVKQVINQKTSFSALPPEQILKSIELKKEKLQIIIPQIERSFTDSCEGVSVFEGITAFMNLLYLFLPKSSPIYAFDIPKTVPEIIRFHINQFHKERIKKRVPMYHIYDYDAKERINYLKKIPFTYAKQGEKNRNSVVSTLVCGNTTLIVNWGKNIKTVKIVDLDVAQAYESQFKSLWGEKIYARPQKRGKQ